MIATATVSQKSPVKHSLYLLGALTVLAVAALAQWQPQGAGSFSGSALADSSQNRWPDVSKKSPVEIPLKHRRFTPSPGSMAPKNASTKRWHGLIQFYAHPTVATLATLRGKGVKIQHYVDENVVAGAIPPGFNAAAVKEIRWIGPLAASDKISTYFQKAALVEFFPDASAAEIKAAIDAVGATALPSPSLPPRIAYVNLSTTQATQLAANDNVAWIGAAPEALAQGKKVYYCPGQETEVGPIAPYSTRFATFSSGWDGPGQGSASLFFHFTNSTPDLPVGTQQADLIRALNKWSEVAAITWTQTATAKADNSVDLAFKSIDGAFNTLAVTPSVFDSATLEMIDSDIDFDEDETWHSGTNIDLFTVAMHEAGHALGLNHSDDPNSVMFASYHGVMTGLTQDDINGIRSLYAAVTPTPTATPTAAPTATPLPPAISINNATVTEGNSGTVNATFTVSLSKTSTQTVTVNFATANNTAVAPGDFAAKSGSLSFTAGQISKTITVVVVGDTTPESNETFFVNLTSPVGATISDSQGLGTITNDDVSTFTIRGRVSTSTGTGIPNVQITRTGGSNVVTNSTGDYVFTVTPGTYTIAPLITPSLNGVTFSPASRSVTVSTSNLTNINFSAFFSITGHVANSVGVSIPNIQIKRVQGTSTVTVVTDANGNYRFTGVRSGSYTISPNITPAMTGMTFNPASYNVTVNTANLTNINFVVFFSINGKVTNSSGVGIANVQVKRVQGTSTVSVFTDANGNYRFGDVRSGNYTISATQTGKTFSPTSRSVTVGTQNLTNINFIGT